MLRICLFVVLVVTYASASCLQMLQTLSVWNRVQFENNTECTDSFGSIVFPSCNVVTHNGTFDFVSPAEGNASAVNKAGETFSVLFHNSPVTWDAVSFSLWIRLKADAQPTDEIIIANIPNNPLVFVDLSTGGIFISIGYFQIHYFEVGTLNLTSRKWQHVFFSVEEETICEPPTNDEESCYTPFTIILYVDSVRSVFSTGGFPRFVNPTGTGNLIMPKIVGTNVEIDDVIIFNGVLNETEIFAFRNVCYSVVSTPSTSTTVTASPTRTSTVTTTTITASPTTSTTTSTTTTSSSTQTSTTPAVNSAKRRQPPRPKKPRTPEPRKPRK